MPVTAIPHRNFTVVSPHIQGSDVKATQEDLCWWADRFDLDPTEIDGEWGPDSRRLARQVLFLLGALDKRYNDAFTDHEQKIIAHHTKPSLPPELSKSARRRSDHRRAAHRAKTKRNRDQMHGPNGVVREGERWVGTKEMPPDSNRGPHISDWERAAGMGAGPWCGAFAIHCARTGGFVVPNTWVYVPTIIADASAGRYGRIVPLSQVKPGDLLCFDWDGGVYDHVGIATTAGGLESVEGNTSAGAAGSQSNGGMVANRHNHAASARRCVGIRLTKTR